MPTFLLFKLFYVAIARLLLSELFSAIIALLCYSSSCSLLTDNKFLLNFTLSKQSINYFNYKLHVFTVELQLFMAFPLHVSNTFC